MRYLSYFLAVFVLLLYSCEEEDNKRPFGTLIEVPSEVETIKDAIKIAQPYDTVLLQAKEYFEWNIEIDKPIFITSQFLFETDSSLIDQTIINANNESRVFTIDGILDTLRMNGFTIKNGHAKLIDVLPPDAEIFDFNGGGIYCNSSNLKLTNIVMDDNLASEPTSRGIGGGIYINESKVYLDNVVIKNNSALDYAGGIFCENSSFYCLNSKFENNTVAFGGATLYFNDSYLSIKNSVIKDNPNPREEYSDISIFGCTGIMENVQVINDSINFETSSIELINCTIPGH